MKKYYYMTTGEGLEKLSDFINKCNPPDGMTKEEMIDTITKILQDEQVVPKEYAFGRLKTMEFYDWRN